MENSFIKDYMLKLLEDVYSNDLERLKAINYGLDYILNNLQYNRETEKDIYNYNKITTCFLTLKEIIEEEEENEALPF